MIDRIIALALMAGFGLSAAAAIAWAVFVLGLAIKIIGGDR